MSTERVERERSTLALGIVLAVVGTVGLLAALVEAHRPTAFALLLVASLVWVGTWAALMARGRKTRAAMRARLSAERTVHVLGEARRAVLRNDDPRSALVEGVVAVSGAVLAILSEVRDGELVPTAAAGTPVPDFTLPLDRPSLARLVLESGEPLQTRDIHREAGGDHGTLAAIEGMLGKPLHSVALMPITVNAVTVGVLSAAFEAESSGLADQALTILSLLADEAAVAIEREQLLARLEQLSLQDALTGLANRRAWEEALNHLGRDSSMALIDLDHFKRVNDTRGHPAGDSILKQFAAVASSAVREEDLIARIGGEEFAILSSGGSELNEALQRIRRAWAATGTGVTFSAGIARRRFGEPTDLLHARCDRSLYFAKEAGRDCIVTDTTQGYVRGQFAESAELA